jgi:hypothetical protein
VSTFDSISYVSKTLGFKLNISSVSLLRFDRVNILNRVFYEHLISLKLEFVFFAYLNISQLQNEKKLKFIIKGISTFDCIEWNYNFKDARN